MSEEKESLITDQKEPVSLEGEEGISSGPEHKGPENQTSFHLDLEGLVTPISGDNPAGESLRYEGTYDKIQEAREEEADLPRGVWERELKKADWNEVRDLCIGALKDRTKDIQIGVWLLESLLHLYGFHGASEGLQLLLGLCEGFWDHLYPEIEGDDLEGRVSPFVWMNEKLYLKLKLIPITQPESIDAHPYSWADWEHAKHLESTSPKASKDEIAAEPTRAKFLGSAMFTSKSFYGAQSESLTTSIEITGQLGDFLDERCGNQAPSLKKFKDTLEDIHNLMNDFLIQKQEENEDQVSEAEGEREGLLAAPENGKEAGKRPLVGAIRSRAEAYRMLSEAADYLLMHEPHSPAPYLVKRAVSWGNMTLNEVLQELVSGDSDLQQIYKLLGIKSPEGGKKSGPKA
jgi:type VI secretion system protein ImpA